MGCMVLFHTLEKRKSEACCPVSLGHWSPLRLTFW